MRTLFRENFGLPLIPIRLNGTCIRIPDLSEKFVYFNDDMFLMKSRLKKKIFFRMAEPVDMLAFQPDVANIDNPVMPYIYLNNTMLLAKYFR